jgi:DNA/RNA-binding domain of Phe-tRNA-synthetase-like protein
LATPHRDRGHFLYGLHDSVMMQVVISDEVRAAYGDLHLAYLEIRGMRIGTDSEKVTGLLRETSEGISKSISLEVVKDRVDFRAYRDFFWRLGVDPTKTRPASEALVRRILKNSFIPRINDFVDSYNIASIETGVPIAAFDLDTVEEEISLRFSEGGEGFLGIGMSSPKSLEKGVLIMSSGEETVAIYPYRDAEESKITLGTKDAVLISCGVPGISEQKLMEAAGCARDRVISVCGGHPSRMKTA